MKMKIEMSGKRRRLLAVFLENAMPAVTVHVGPERFEGMTPEDSKEVRETLDDIYTFCTPSDNQETGEEAHGT